MERPHGCSDCQHWEKTYEMVTLSYFRLQSQFQIAALCCDPEVTAKLASEIQEAAARRSEIRDATRRHLDSIHVSALEAYVRHSSC